MWKHWRGKFQLEPGHQHRTFLDNKPSASEMVPVFKFRLCPGPLVPWREGRLRLLFPVQLEVKVLSSVYALAP